MTKQFNISFSYDIESDSVSGLKCVVDGIEKKRKSTKKLKDESVENTLDPLIILEENKLVLNDAVISKLQLEFGDKIIIEYKQRNKKLVPTIRKDKEIGNKISKSNTVTYRGKANLVLAEYGKRFSISPFGDDSWELINNCPIISEYKEITDENIINNLVEETDNFDLDLIVKSDSDYEIDELTYSL